MKERIRSLISILKHDATDEEAIDGLEELITGDEADSHRGEILEEFEEGRKTLVASGRFEAACKLIDMELALVEDSARETNLLIEQARLFDDELFKQKEALGKYKKAANLNPDDAELAQKVTAIEAERENWQQIVETFCDQAEASTEDSLKAHMLYSAAERTYKNHRRGKDIPSLLRSALRTDPTHLKAARLLERVLKERERWDELGELYAKLAEHRRSKDERAQMLLAAAHTFLYRLEDKEAAGIYYSEVLDLMPGNEVALKFLVKFYEEQEDWEHLVAVYEDALSGRLSTEEEVAMLMQAGMIHWRMRGNMDAAESAFRRLKKIDASHAGMINFYRAYSSETGDNSKLLQILNDAQRATNDPERSDELTKEIAQLAASDGGNVERAIDAWKSVFRKEPDNAEAKEELARLYRESEKWNALLDLLKGEAEGLDDEDIAGKVAVYEEIVKIYRDKLSLGTLVINTYKTILALDPANIPAQEALSETYEKEGRWNDLINILNSRATATEDPEEKIALLLRVASLWTERFNNFNRAVDPLEEILKIDSTNVQAIDTLKGVYERRRAWRPLLSLLKKELEILDGDDKRKRLEDMAHLAAERLSDHAQAIQLWRQVLEIDPESGEALTSLEKLSERAKDWEGLTDVIERRVERTDGEDEKVALLTKLGIVFKDRLRDPTRAAGAWKKVLEVKPGHAKAMRSLKEAYLAAQDWEALEELYSEVDDYEGLVEVLGIAADRISDPETKKKLSFRCAEIYDDPIGQSDRAVRHYERVLSVEAKNERAARALAPIYRRGEKWNRLLNVLEILLDYTDEKDERVGLMEEIREIAATRMNNRALAFDWAAKAFSEKPNDEAVRETLETAAEAGDKFEELVSVYKEKLDTFEGDERLAMERHIAELSMTRLGAVDDAVASYRAILEATPNDNDALMALDEIFRSNARWDDLVGIYEQRIEATDEDSKKRDLTIELARLFEDGMDRLDLAEERYLFVLEASPDDSEVLVSLERIARLTEKWKDLAEILGRRRKLDGIDDDEWRDISSQLASLFDEQLEDIDQSIAVYTELLNRYPGDVSTIDTMEHFLRDEDAQGEVATILKPHLETSEDWRRLAWALAILIENTDDRIERLVLQTQLADVYGEKLGDERVAFETLGAALKEHPSDTSLWDRMTTLASALDCLSDLADRLAEAYRSDELDEAVQIDLARRLAELLDVQLGCPADAAQYHLKVFETEPGSQISFESLETWYTGEEKWDELLVLYKSALESGEAIYSPLDMHLKVCFIHEEVRQNVPEAIQAYRSVMELDPGNTQAVRALTTLYEDAGQWEDLSELLQSELYNTTGEEAAALRYRLGEIAERRLDRTEDALDYYEQVLNEDPDHLRSQEALERLIEVSELRLRAAKVLVQTYEHQGATEPLTRVLMIGLENEDLDTIEKAEILIRVADLRERRLGDHEGAFAAMADAFALSPSDEKVRQDLARLAAENSLNDRYAQTLDKAIPKIEDDIVVAAKLIAEVARIYDEQLGDLARAEGAYRRLLELDPDNPETAMPAVRALERILSGGESWEQLLEVLRVKVQFTDDPSDRKEILHRMAEIEESVLERIGNAVDLFKEVLDYDDSDMSALFGLERLYERREEWPELVDILRRRAIIESSSGMRRDLLFRVATLYEEQIGDVDEAISAYIQVGDEAGPDRESLDALSRLYKQTKRWRDLLDVYEAEEQMVGSLEERAALFFKMGSLLQKELDEPEQAVSRLGEALAIDSTHEDARSSLEAMLDGPVRVEAIHILRPIYEQEAAYAKLLNCDEIEVEETEDPLERAKIFRRAAEVAEVGLEQPERAFKLTGKAFRDGTADPDLSRIIDDLERLAERVDGHKKLTELYREVGPDILDGDVQVRCNLRVAQIAHTVLDDLELARDYYVKVLDIDGENTQALDALEEIYEKMERHLELFEIYRRKSQYTDDEEVRRSILFKQARVCEVNLEDISGAMSTYETILESDESNSEAMAALERLYPQAERWADLMGLLERRAEADFGERVDLLHRLGNLAEEKLGDNESALDYYSRALEIDSTHAGTLESLEAAMDDDSLRGRVAEILEPVYKSRGDWTKLVSAMEAQLEYCDDPFERKELLKRIGHLHEEQLTNLEKAFETFARLFREDIEDRSSWDVLTRLTSNLDIWDQLAEVYSGSLDDVVGDTPTTAELSFLLGEIYETRLEKAEEAIAAYRRTLAFAPDDPKAFSAVERGLLATAAWPELLELYRDAADAAMEDDRRKDFIFKIAEIQESANEDIDAAIEAFRDVMDIDDRDERAVTSLDRLYFQAERFDDLAMHLRAQIDQSDEPRTRNALRIRLGRVYEENVDDLTSAVDVFEEALREEGGGIVEPLSALENLILKEDQRQRIAEILEPIYRETDEWKKLIVILQTQVEFVDDPIEVSSKWKEIANLHSSRGQNFLLAFEAFASAFEADPSDRETMSEMVRLAKDIDNWDELAKILAKVIDNIYDLDFKIEVLQLLGSTYDQRLDMPRKAISAFQAVLEINEADNAALDSLEGLHNLVGDWEGLVDVLAQKASFASDPSDRAELLRTKASIHEDLMSSPEDAISSYRQALDAEPSSIATLDALERLYEGAEEWHDLIEIKRQHADVTTDEEEFLTIARSIALVYEEHLDDNFEAINAWRTVLERSSTDSIAIQALGKLYDKESMYVELLDNLTLQRELTGDQATLVELSMQIGNLQEKELSDLEAAIESYGDVLTQQPTHADAIASLEEIAKDESVRSRAIEVLEPLHREYARWDQLAAIVELKLEILDGQEERLKELLALADLHDTGRSDPLAAFDVYARALETEPSSVDVMEALERIASSQGLWKRLTETYARQADNVYDAETEWRLLMRLGEVRETQLHDSSGAIEAYRRALDGGCTEEIVLASLDRLYERESMWTELDEIMERQIETAESSDDVNRFKLRQGMIREREFDDVPGAITAFKDVVETSPDNNEAVAALQALLSRDEFVEDIVEVLYPVYETRAEKEMISELFEHRLRVADTDGEKVQLYRDLAVHQEQTVGDLSATFDAFGRAFSLDPADSTLLDELERLAEELGAWAALVETVEKVLDGDVLDPSSAVELGLQVAKWAATNVGDPAKAETLYRSVLVREPEHQEALSALEELLRNLGRFEELIPVMKTRAEAVYDFAVKKELYMSIAQIARFELGDAEQAIEAYLAVRDLDESDLPALDALIELNEEANKYEELVALLLSRAEYTPDPGEGNTFRHRAATLYVGPMEDMENAVDIFRSVLDNDPLDKDAVTGLEGIFEKLDRWNDLSDLIMQQLDMADRDEDRVVLYKRLAVLHETRFEEFEDAIGHLSEVLMIDPGDTEAAEGLERLYTKTERWQDLVELLENQADRARDAGDGEGELGLLVRIGEIYNERLDDTERATDIYERVLERDPEHTRALAALARLYEAAADWEQCAEVLTKAAAAGRGGPDEAEVHFRLARLNEAHLGDEAKALEELRLAVEFDPGHMEANKSLAEHCRKSGDNEGLLEAFMREEAHMEDGDARVSKLLEIADLQAEALSDSAGAVASLEKARDMASDNKDVLLKLSDAYVTAGRQDDAIPVIESLIDAETNGGKKRSKKAAVYHHSLAKAYIARGEQEKGVEHFEAAYKLDISNLEVLISLGKLHYEREDYDKAVKLFRALLLQRFKTAAGVTKADIYWYVGDISLKQGDKRKAKGMFQRGLDEDKGHEGCKTGLTECS
ncbi:MAG: tetratricopeptide repeat protein [Deltaproteobacteria bacterium]|nr:tetratricopeptide repeat protein [Deltaproteobacteria bacterium]